MNTMNEGKYRTRTALRGRMPGPLTGLFPKGRHDCGAHEWYRADESTWRCYHCEPGETHVNPFTPEQEIAGAIRLAAHTVYNDAELIGTVAQQVARAVSMIQVSEAHPTSAHLTTAGRERIEHEYFHACDQAAAIRAAEQIASQPYARSPGFAVFLSMPTAFDRFMDDRAAEQLRTYVQARWEHDVARALLADFERERTER